MSEHLNSHYPEHRSYPAKKMVPIAETRSACSSIQRQLYKHEHNKRVRRYYQQQIRQES